MQIPVKYIKKFNVVESEAECVFEIVFQYNNWNGKVNILSSDICFSFFTPNHKKTLFYAFQASKHLSGYLYHKRTNAKSKAGTPPTATSNFRG